MHKQAILLFLLLSAGQLFAQYAPFPAEQATWRQKATLFDPTGNQESIHHYFLNGDTTINGTDYTKLYYDFAGLYFGGPYQLPDTANAVYCGAIREDSSQKIYYHNTGSSTTPFSHLNAVPQSPYQEFLLYDFSVQIGDTFYTQNGVGTLINVVGLIDSTTIGGVTRKQFHITKGYSPTELYYFDTQVEGIGSMQDLLMPFNTPFEEGYQLLCFEDSTVAFGDCFILGLAEEVAPAMRVEVGPHPIVPHSSLLIESSLPGMLELEVVGLDGRGVWQGKVTGGSSQPFARMGLDSGMCLYRLSQNGETLRTGKWLVR